MILGDYVNTNFLDKGLPVISGNELLAKAEIEKFKKYCQSLNKEPSELTKEELVKFYGQSTNV